MSSWIETTREMRSVLPQVDVGFGYMMSVALGMTPEMLRSFAYTKGLGLELFDKTEGVYDIRVLAEACERALGRGRGASFDCASDCPCRTMTIASADEFWDAS